MPQQQDRYTKNSPQLYKLLILPLKINSIFMHYFSRPTTLDAVVFAHLAVIWKARLPNNKLNNYLQGYDNLCSFCGRVLQRYFPLEEEGKPVKTF